MVQYTMVNFGEVTSVGYREEIAACGAAERENWQVFDCVDSTNLVCKRWALEDVPDGAVAIADEPVGVDIEALERNYARVKSRFMSPAEEALSEMEEWPAVVWTAKEAIYKLYGKREVDLTMDIRITAFDAERMLLMAEVRDTKGIVVEAQIIENSVAVATATYK